MTQEINRNSDLYKAQKAAFELVSSDAWRLILFPAIEQVIYAEDKVPIMSLDDAFKAAQVQGRSTFARNLLSKVEQLSGAFAKRG